MSGNLEIDSTRVVADVAARIGTLGVEVADIAGHLEELTTRITHQATQLTAAVKRMEARLSSLAPVVKKIGDDSLAESAAENLEACDTTLSELGQLANGVAQSSANLTAADRRVEELLSHSEALFSYIAESDLVTADTPIVAIAIATAERIGKEFEAAIARGELTQAQLFDERYREIPGTNPKQYVTDYLELADRVLPPIQDPVLAADPRIVYCVAWARGGYLPTHNPEYSKVQGRDPVWNAANCRNRRIYNDRTAQKVAQSTKRFLLQTYRRNMGGGRFVLMKDLSAPIFVHGRHWGAFRIGLRQD